MRPIRLATLLALALTLAAPAGAQKTVQKAADGTHAITENLTFGSGRTGTFSAGSTLSVNGTFSGTPTGGTLDLSNVTLVGPGSGTVTSVALALPNIFSVSGSPVTASGTLTGTLATQTANTVFAGPTTGGAAAPAFRALVAADVPDLSGTYQPLDADLTTYAGITPSANIQTFLGAADYAAMRTQLGLVIGTNVQAYDADLTTYAGITPSANIQTFLGAADYAAMRTQLGLVIGTDVQAYDADLADLADGSLTGSKVGTGIDADNITAGTLADARIASTLARDSEVAAGYQPLDSDLTAVAALTTTSDGRSLLTATALTAAGLGLTNGSVIDAWGAITASSGVASRVSDETGSGALVFATSPTLVTPTLGAATATSVNGLTINSTTGTLAVASGKTATVSNTLTFAGTDGSTLNVGTGGALGTAAYTAASTYLPVAGGTMTGNLTMTDLTNLQWSGGGYLTGAGGGFSVAVANGLSFGVYGGAFYIDDTSAATTTNTGSIVNSGGFGNAGNAVIGGIIYAGSGTTALTDSAGKILSAALNTVAPAQGGTGITSLGTGVATLLGTPSSANLAAAITDETGAGAAVFATGPQLLDNASLGTDDTWSGRAISGLTAGATIAQWEAVYLGGSSTWLLADANSTGTYPARGLAVAAYSDTNAAVVLTGGTVRNDAWAWTPGGTLYLSATAGGLTQTAPSTTGDKVQAVGFALTADIAFFDFDSTWVEVD